VKPERVLIPLVAVVLAVFGTSRVMESVAPATPHAASASDSDGGGGDGEGDGKGGHKKERKRETHTFFSAAGMRDLIALIRKEGGPEGRVSLFRIQANDAQVFVKSSSTEGGMLVIERGPKVRFKGTSPVAPPGGFSLGKLDVHAPQRIGDGIARLSNATLADVDYMVFLINPVTGDGGWETFLATGDHTHFHADADGRHVTRP
jgi:hypothetical protein